MESPTSRRADRYRSPSEESPGLRRLSLKTVFVVVAIASIFCAWWADRSRLHRMLEAERKENFLTGHSWQERRKNIVEAASQPEPDVAMLLFALSDPDHRVRETALDALRKILPTKYPARFYQSSDGRELTEFERWLVANPRDE